MRIIESEKFWYTLVLFALFTVIWIAFFPKMMKCGNGVCEFGENFKNCCIDCGCPPGYKCKENTCIFVQRVSVCGNGLCEPSENCFDCPLDCKCGEGEYCSEEKKRCMKPVCGNNLCEPFEDSSNCCIDCGCPYPVEECNRVTNKCEFEMKISDERILQLVNEYFRDKNMSVINAEIFAPEIYEGKKAKIVVVEVEGLNYPLSVLVTEDEEIIELPTY